MDEKVGYKMIEDTYKYLLKIAIIFLIILSFLVVYFIFTDSKTIKIGTKNMTEQQVIAYTLKDVIEAKTDYKVDLVTGMDTSSILNNALIHDDIDLYVEYSSVAFIELYKHEYENQSKEEIKEIIKKDYKKDNLNWYTDLGFENSNVIICGDVCYKEDINKLSEIPVDYNFNFGAAPYFYERSDGFNLLTNTYGFNNYKKTNLDSTLIYSAIENNDIDLGLSFSTDAKLYNNDNFKILEDDLLAFPSYEAGIVISDNALEKYPELSSVLSMFEDYFTTEDIQKYNKMVENDGYSAQEVGDLIAKEMLK